MRFCLAGDDAGPALAQAPGRRYRLEGVAGEDSLRFVGPSGHAQPLKVRCDSPEIANLGVVGWLKGGVEMLVVAQVPPHSSCRNMGRLHGYRVATGTGRILESLPYAALRKRWPRELGCNVQPMQ